MVSLAVSCLYPLPSQLLTHICLSYLPTRVSLSAPALCSTAGGSKSSASYEPLLLENEREAVADLLQYLESESTARASLSLRAGAPIGLELQPLRECGEITKADLRQRRAADSHEAPPPRARELKPAVFCWREEVCHGSRSGSEGRLAVAYLSEEQDR